MAGVNKVILVGNLGQDPEVRHLEGGASVATFSIATSDSYTDRDGNRQTQTEWHNIVMWRGLATIAEKYLRKGSKVYIEGKLQYRTYEKDGVTRYITDIVARDMQMLDSRQDGQSNNGGYVPPTAANAPAAQPTSTPTPAATPQATPDLSAAEGKDDLPF
ncbi:single-stranded DNA-binding protein [Flammeovirga kamogawensis]|uniref:Single-stranded DNA-binding protein n=1 Tax=Flammeovirga kamogawensis TaxID=373891 RepID=A0ABX8GRU1_9BACT|nr:single-stranded DNA-binding protein [Flammeovirga kamogawensis]MBB6461351.1 single-strand DNA-binding protein [Flammeovirga kamogawensis]QWG06256.1 single-stranded DNA-binding protein [Flammeovirga kamogawensis]TRX68086.1 single-stranded DNA-binding protein [Flammeovirga kamogawensis]